MKTKLALLTLAAFGLTACDDALFKGLGNQPAPEPAEEQPAEPRKPAVSPLEVPIETNAVEATPLATADAETFNTEAFIASGNEPFWRVEASGSSARYVTPENQNGRNISVTRLAFDEGVEFIGVLGERPFSLTVRSRDCQDDMSGKEFPMTATLTVRGQKLDGCAQPGQIVTQETAATAPAEAEASAAASEG